MTMWGNYVIFGGYLLLLVAIGYVTYRKTTSYDDYSLAGRSNNKWITAISAESSDMSGWLLLGLPGMAFSMGFGSLWVVTGILFGTLFNWTVIANRLRRASEFYGAVTLTEFFEKRLGDSRGIIGCIAAIVIILFMIINASAEIIGSGKLLNIAFGLEYKTGIVLGLFIVMIYTYLGGYLAVSWSNLIQGSIIFLALILVPLVALGHIESSAWLGEHLLKENPEFFSFFSGSSGFWSRCALVLGGIGIGVGYPGQPHILTSFMSIKDPREIRDSTLIAMLWVGLTTYGAVMVGIIGRAIFQDIGDPEQIFLALTGEVFPSYTIGLFAAAVMAAILSSVSAYFLVAAASYASNIYKRFKKVESLEQLVPVERLAVVVISVAAFLMSLSGGLVFDIALYAWGGLAACFGPLVLLSLYSEKINLPGAVVGMLVGMVTILGWYNLGYSDFLYELIPGFAFSLMAMYGVSLGTGGASVASLQRFREFRTLLKS
ncbi:MAG TPA: sodium/proline symporter [Synergistaceae bacterium]|nr:sodium/proline symporter [Synergistaceae bacterium]HPQ36805.1 sodium/proline symporter [Synergistaceae bacterium]